MRLFGEVTYVVEKRPDSAGEKLVVRQAGSPALLIATAVLVVGTVVFVLARAHL